MNAEVGTEYGPSSWVSVSQERIDAFAEATEDRQWIHVDRERALASSLGTTIAHGYLTLALLPVMMREVVPRPSTGMTVNYGLNRLRFPAPVPAGARIRARFHIDSIDPIAGDFEQVCTATIEREGSEKPVCVAEIVYRFHV